MIKVEGELTGKRRYRKNHHLLILQVEEAVFVTGREDKQGRWVCEWRDATISDVVNEIVV